MTSSSKTRIAKLLTLLPALAGLALLLALTPPGAKAQTTCGAAPGDTYVPGGSPDDPGAVVAGPGEACPEAEPVEVTPEPLPPDPVCEPCPPDKSKPRSGTGSSNASGTAPTANTFASAEPAPAEISKLPFTGYDKVQAFLILGGIGLVALGIGFGLRRRLTEI